MSANSLVSGWQNVRLGDIIELKYGKSLPAKDRDNTGYPVYGSNGIVGEHSQPLVKIQGLIVGRKGSYGEVTLSEQPFFPIDTTYYVDEFYGQPIDYWYYLLKFLPLTELNRSTAVPGLNRDDAYSLEIQLPSLAEQQVIADKLNILLAQVESIKARLERIPEILKQLRQSVLTDAISGKLTKEWRTSRNLPLWSEGLLGEFIEKPSYGTSEKSQPEGEIPVLRMGNLQNGEVDWKDLVYTSNPLDIAKYKLEPGDVLFNRTNSPELVGKTSIYRGEREAIYAGYIIRIRCLPKLNAEFLNYCLNSPVGRDYCRMVKSDGVSQSNINAKKLTDFPLSCPPPEEQQEIVNRVNQFFEYTNLIEQQLHSALERVNNLTQSILVKTFHGELTTEWREDNLELISGKNSAEALLARIKAERLVKPTTTRGRGKK